MQTLHRTLINADPRLKIAVALTTGLSVWHADSLGVLFYAFFLCILGVAARLFPQNSRNTLAAYAGFTLLWVAVKIGVDLLSGKETAEALADGGLLGVRLAMVLFIGLFLAEITSLRSLGAAVSWALRPLFKSNAWKGALALALTVHFLPLIWSTTRTIRGTMKLRGASLPLHRRVPLFTGALMRSLGQKTWSRTVALAARGLDEPQAWDIRLSTSIMECLTALVLAALSALPAFL